MARKPCSKPTREYNTRANQKKKNDAVEQENVELREEVTTLKENLERLNALVASLVIAQNQPPPPPPTILLEAVEELRKGQDSLKEEVNQLKTQMSLVIRVVLRGEGDPSPNSSRAYTIPQPWVISPLPLQQYQQQP
jgi:cell division protein FtsB